MLTVNIHEAKTNLSKLIQMAVDGQPFVIANRGKPMVTVTAFDAPEKTRPLRIGFAKGLWTVPDDIKTPFKDEIEEMFYGGSIFPPERDGGEHDGEERDGEERNGGGR